MAQLKYEITFGLVNVPVKLEAAAREDKVRFKTVTADGAGVKHKLFTGDTAVDDKATLRKGFETPDGTVAVLEQADIDALKPKKSTKIDLGEFVPAIDAIYFKASYYVSPASDHDEGYALLFAVLNESGRYAIGKAVMFGRECPVAIRTYRSGLMLYRLFFEEEIRAVREFRTDLSILDSPLGKKKLEMSRALAYMMEAAAFDPSKYVDSHKQSIKALLAAKTANLPAPAAAPDIMAVMEQSLQMLMSKRGAVVAAAEVIEAQNDKATRRSASRKRRMPAAATSTPLLDEIVEAA